MPDSPRHDRARKGGEPSRAARDEQRACMTALRPDAPDPLTPAERAAFEARRRERVETTLARIVCDVRARRRAREAAAGEEHSHSHGHGDVEHES